MPVLSFPNKAIRARVIADHVRRANLPGVVCFTCGNAAEALRAQGLRVVEVGPRGPLHPARWFTFTDVAATWPGFFDATSGHLPMPLMLEVAQAFRDTLGRLDPGQTYQVPTGSGETLCCLVLAYPGVRFVPCYDETNPATRYDAEAPLNPLVRALSQGDTPWAS